ncbi:MAG: LysM peptidoglycan-binding domain-containing protein [Chloroflexi bacterium]|nr:LysM peptidoglycan-binding domain-containing protein [Chloroflexota bacterium]
MSVTNLLSGKRVLGVLVVVLFALALIPPLEVTHAQGPYGGSYGASYGGSMVYYVQRFDTLFSISQRYGTSIAAIMSANGLYSDYIYAGQRLVIPGGYPNYWFHRSGSSIYAPQPLPTIVPIENPTFDCTYTVQPRDTVFSISYRSTVTIPALMQANNLYSPFIYVGQVLKVPCLNPAPSTFPIYTVQSGDNLFRIAIQYNTSIYAITLVNGLLNPNWIFAGQNLVIPYPGSYVWPTGIPTLVPSITPATTATATTTPTITPTPTSTVPPNTAVVIMQSNAYVPNNVTITAGMTVLWENADTGNHTVSSGTPGNLDGNFRSDTIAPGGSFSFTFSTAGTYPYFDEIVGAAMTGTVTVQ